MPHAPAASYPTTIWNGDTDNIDRQNRDIQTSPDPRDWDRIVSEVIAVQTELDSIKTDGLPFEKRTITANTSLGDGYEIVYADAATGNITVTLPTASDNTGFIKIIKKIDSTANLVTVSGGTIDGVATKEIAYQWSSMQLMCDGSGWSVV